jgi:hypothetical protein
MFRKKILLSGIQLTHVKCHWGSTVKMVLSYKSFTLNEANTCVALFPSVSTKLMDHKLQLLKPLNNRELYTTYSFAKYTVPIRISYEKSWVDWIRQVGKKNLFLSFNLFFSYYFFQRFLHKEPNTLCGTLNYSRRKISTRLATKKLYISWIMTLIFWRKRII